MPVTRFLSLVDTEPGLKVVVLLKGLGPNEDSLKPMAKVNEDIPQLVTNILDRQSTP